jgi:hypothetical protein
METGFAIVDLAPVGIMVSMTFSPKTVPFRTGENLVK